MRNGFAGLQLVSVRQFLRGNAPCGVDAGRPASHPRFHAISWDRRPKVTCTAYLDKRWKLPFVAGNLHRLSSSLLQCSVPLHGRGRCRAPRAASHPPGRCRPAAKRAPQRNRASRARPSLRFVRARRPPPGRCRLGGRLRHAREGVSPVYLRHLRRISGVSPSPPSYPRSLQASAPQAARAVSSASENSPSHSTDLRWVTALTSDGSRH